MCMEDGGEEDPDPPEVAAVGVEAVEVEAGLQDHHQAQAQVEAVVGVEVGHQDHHHPALAHQVVVGSHLGLK